MPSNHILFSHILKEDTHTHTHTHTHTLTVEYYAATKKNEMLTFATLWINLGCIMLSEISQQGKNGMISLICGREKSKTNEHSQLNKDKLTENRLMRDLGREES